MRIAIIDDEDELLETLRLSWPDEADELETFSSFEALKPVLYSRGFSSIDCVILDLNLPDASGSQVFEEIRRLSRAPIIILSGWGDTEFRADLINRGIDDYVLKPASARELHARAARLVRRQMPAEPVPAAPIRIGSIDYIPNERVLRISDQSADLTHVEAGLIDTLAAAGGRPVSRDDLYLKAFGRPYKEGEKVLETYISRVRQKLESLEPGAGQAVQTARSIGYRLAAQTV